MEEEEEEPIQTRLIQRQEAETEEEELLQGKFTTAESPAQRHGDGAAAENRNGLPRQLKMGLETLSGMDLSSVRVHSNSARPAQFNALAYTQGQDIHVGLGQEQHLPHEGWHAVQQMQGRVQPTIQAKGVSINDDAHLEREADVMGAKAAVHQPYRSIKSDIHRQRDEEEKEGIVQAKPVIQRQRDEEEEELLQGKFAANEASTRLQDGGATALTPVSQRVVARSVIQREAEDDAKPRTIGNFEPVARDYIVEWELFPSSLVSYVGELPIALPGDYFEWTFGSSQLTSLVCQRLFAKGRKSLPEAIAKVITPTNLELLVEKTRVAVSANRRDDLRKERYPAAHVADLLPGKLDVAIAIASAIHSRVVKSVARLARPYAGACMRRGYEGLDLKPKERDDFLRFTGLPQAEISDLPMHHPMDALVAGALCDRPKPVRIDYDKAKSAGITPTQHDVREISVTPVAGAKGWYRAKPEDATAEEVALAGLGDATKTYQLVAAPPLWAVRTELTDKRVDSRYERASLSKGLEAWFPSDLVETMLEAHGLGSAPNPEAALLSSDSADEVALAQAGPVPMGVKMDREEAVAKLTRCKDQLQSCAREAKHFHLDGMVVEAQARIDARIEMMYTATPEQAAQWGYHAQKQSAVLYRALSGLGRASAQFQTTSAKAVSQENIAESVTSAFEQGDAESAAALSGAGVGVTSFEDLPKGVRETLLAVATSYVRAAAFSEFIGIGQTHLAEAAAAEKRAAADALDQLLTESLATTENLRGTSQEFMPQEFEFDRETGTGDFNTRRTDMRLEVAKLRAGLAAGDPSAAAEAARLAIDADRMRTETQMVELIARMRQVKEILFDLGQTWQNIITFNADDLHDLSGKAFNLNRGFSSIYKRWAARLNIWQAAQDWEKFATEGGFEDSVAKARERKAWMETELQEWQQGFHEYVEKEKVYEFLKAAYDEIDEAQTRIMIVDLVTILAITVASMGAGAIAGGAAAGFRLGATAQFVAATAAEAVVFAGLDAAAFGRDSMVAQIATDAGFNFAQFGAIRAFGAIMKVGRLGKAMEAGAKEGASVGQRVAGKALRGAELSVNGLITGGVQYAQMQFEHMRDAGRTMTREELYEAGLKGLGMMIAGAILGRKIDKLRGYSQATIDKARAANNLRRQLRRQARIAKKKGDPETTRELIRADREALEADLDYYKTLKNDSDALKKAELTETQVGDIESSLAGSLADMKALELTTSLEPIAAGEYQVDSKRIGEIRTEYQKLGTPVSELNIEAQTGRPYFYIHSPDGTHVRIGGKLKGSDPFKTRSSGRSQTSEAEGRSRRSRRVAENEESFGDAEFDAVIHDLRDSEFGHGLEAARRRTPESLPVDTTRTRAQVDRSAHGSARRNPPPGRVPGAQIQHNTKTLDVTRNLPPGMAPLHPDVINENINWLQSRTNRPSTELHVDPEGGGTRHYIDDVPRGREGDQGLRGEQLDLFSPPTQSRSADYSTEHKMMDNYIIPRESRRIAESRQRTGLPPLDPRMLAIAAGEQARYILTGHSGTQRSGRMVEVTSGGDPAPASVSTDSGQLVFDFENGAY
jgi:hypothetical protein